MAKYRLVVDGQPGSVEYSSPEQLQVTIEHLRSQGHKVEPEGTNRGDAVLAGGAQGLTFGLSDEIGARFKSLVTDESYEDLRDMSRIKHDLLKEQHPWMYHGAEFGTGMIVPGGAAVKGVKGAATAPRAIARLATIGAGEGAVAGYGYSEGEDAGDVLVDTAIGATTGGVLSPLVGTVAPATGHLAGKLGRMAAETPEAAAQRAVGRGLLTEGIDTAEDAVARLEDAGSLATLMDVNEQLLGLGGATKDISDEAAGLINRAVDTRQAGARGRVISALDEATTQPTGNYDAVKARLISEKAAAGELYKPFIDTTDVAMSSELQDYLKRPLIKPFLDKAVAAYETKTGVPIGDGLADADTIPLWILNDIKKRADKAYEAATSPLQPNPTVAGDADIYNVIKQKIRGLADEAEPRYPEARAAFAEPAGDLAALKAGRKVKNSELAIDKAEKFLETGNQGGALSPGQEGLFKLGVASRLAKDTGRGETGKYTNYAKKIYGGALDDAKGERLAMAAKDDAALGMLSDKLRAETGYHETMQYLRNTTGSKTAARQAAQGKADDTVSALSETLRSFQTGDPLDIIARVARMNRMTEPQAVEVAKILTQQGMTPQQLADLVAAGQMPADIGEAILKSMSGGIAPRLAAGATTSGTGMLVD